MPGKGEAVDENEGEHEGERGRDDGPVLRFECDIYSFGCIMLQVRLILQKNIGD